jgi:methanethiol S-methyltransferase
VAHWPPICSITVFPASVVTDFLLSRREERAVLSEFGDEYRRYPEQVPTFFPRMGQWKALLERSSITEDQSKL